MGELELFDEGQSIAVEVPRYLDIGNRKFSPGIREGMEKARELAGERHKFRLVCENWRWFLLDTVAFPNEGVVILSRREVSAEEAWTWAEDNAGRRKIVSQVYFDALNFHAHSSCRDSDQTLWLELPSTEILTIDLRDDWSFLGRVHDRTIHEEFLLSRRNRYLAVTAERTGSACYSGRELDLSDASILLQRNGLNVPEQLLEQGAFQILSSGVACADPPPHEIARPLDELPVSGVLRLSLSQTIVGGELAPANTDGQTESLAKVRQQGSGPSSGPKTARETSPSEEEPPVNSEPEADAGEAVDPVSLSHSGKAPPWRPWSEILVRHLKGQPKILAEMMNQNNGEAKRDALIERFPGWSANPSGNMNKLKVRFNEDLDELNEKVEEINEPRRVHRYDNALIVKA